MSDVTMNFETIAAVKGKRHSRVVLNIRDFICLRITDESLMTQIVR